MKKFICVIFICLSGSFLWAQPQMGKYQNEKSLWETVTGLKTKSDKFNLYINMHGSLNFDWVKGDFDQANFKMNQLRIEARGNINDWIYYRWRQRLNRSNDGSGALDNLPTSIDYAAVGFRLSSKFSIFAGKQCATYGGFEFDLNPIDIYQYSDMVDYMDNFLTGINFIYNPISTQELCFQVLDSRNYSFSRTYGYLPSNIKDAKVPFVYTLNWNGSFCEDLIKTRWSASIMQEGKKKNMYYYALGNEFNKGPINAFFDFMYARQALDRKGIMTSIINEDLADGRIDYTALNAKYMSYVLKINCRVTPNWNIFAKGMYETAGLYVENSLREKGKYRTSWGYIGGVEYYPMKSNLHFFLTYVGRSYRFTNRAKALGWGDHSTDQITMGFIYQLPVF